MKIITSIILAAFFSVTVFGQNVIDKHFEELEAQTRTLSDQQRRFDEELAELDRLNN